MEILLEKELRPSVREFFEKKEYQVFNEARVFGRNIDLVARRRSKIVTAELKLKDWRKAISQAWLNLRVSDYAYVALPDTTFARNGRKIFRLALDNGIGILSVNGATTELLPPVRSQQISRTLRKQFIQRMILGRN